MTRPLWASPFLKTARRLAGQDAGRGRPAVSDLRRATSTAYYALFHQITRHGAMDFLPNATEDDIAAISRWFTHTGILQAALVVDAAANTPPHQIKKQYRQADQVVLASGPVPRQLAVVADAFIALQEARHRADYDGAYDPVRPVTVAHVDEADRALRETWSMWRAKNSPKARRLSTHAAYRSFLRLALLYSGGPRQR